MQTEVIKTYQAKELTKEQLDAINRFTRREMQPEELYVFSAVLCDNQIDREGERFSVPCLRELAKLYVGVTGIFDHDPKGSRQTARIFATEVVEDAAAPSNVAEPYTALRAQIYMVRSRSSRDLILEIDAGIKKEISVGCAVRDSVCSVCGASTHGKPCGHSKGRCYEGSDIPCHTVHRGCVDAYEWSFVAVPAQPRAGVVKGYRGNWQEQRALEETELTRLGRIYREQLQREYVRLCQLALPELETGVAGEMAKQMDGVHLMACSRALQKAVQKRLPLQTQLNSALQRQSDGNEGFRL